MKIFKIKNLYSSDLQCGKVSKYIPADREDVYFQMYLEVECCETGKFTEFQCNVVTAKGILRVSNDYDGPNLISERASLVYRYFDYDELKKDLNTILESCIDRGDDLRSVAKKMERYFQWEYENVE